MKIYKCRAFIGSVLSMDTTPLRSSPPLLRGLRDSRRSARLQEEFIASSLRGSLDLSDSLLSNALWEPRPVIGNSPEAPPPSPTVGRRRLPSLELDSNLDLGPYDETVLETGTISNYWPCAVSVLLTKGELSQIPSDVFVRYYSGLVKIAADASRPVSMVRECYVFWGSTGTGKSRRAWDEAGQDAYSKDPRTKWWCGYRNQANVVIDEFRGVVDVSHLLRWFDRYPVSVETKGSSRPLVANKFWITSNLDPRLWYPDLDAETQCALLRRLNITHFN